MADLGSSKVFGDLTVTGSIVNPTLETALDGKVGTGDTRLTNSREWTAETVAQVEAEAGTATTRRAWTAQRVRQAINAVVNAIGNATTTVKGWMSPEDKAKLNGIASGATKNATDAQLRDRVTHTGTQAISTVSGLQTALDGKSATGHTHDDRYYTETEIDAMFNGLTTTPDWTSVLNKPATATRWPAWGEVTGKPSTYAPSAHTHTIANVTGLQAALDGKAASSHTHAYVPTSLTVNGKALSGNISLTAADVGAAASNHSHSYLPLSGGTLTGSLTGAEIYNNGWFRAYGQSGLYCQDYGGGIYMVDTTWVRVYGSKAFYVANQIAATGNITAYYSDERLKTDFKPIQNALTKVQSLEGVHYHANTLAAEFGYDPDKAEVGLKAQQVQAVLPEAVELAPFDIDGETGGSKTGENYLTLKYERLVPLLIEAIKELKAEVDELKRRVE